MNKDVIYIEPEDDITDIISKLRASKLKVVALVPPKKIGVLRSAVNTKLIAKAAKSAGKVVVIVTTDSALTKLSATAGIPIAKSLQSRPKLPSEIIEDTKNEPVIEEEPEEKPKAKSGTQEIKEEDAEKKSEKKESKKPIDLADEKAEKKKKLSKEEKKNLPPLVRYRKWIIAGVVGILLLISFLVWALVINPSAKISVQIRTIADNFSEPVIFTTDAKSANTSEGKFLLETQDYVQDTSVTFEATGKRDVGNKAEGVISAEVYIPVKDVEGDASASIPKGTVFTTSDGFAYTATEGATVTLAANMDYDQCDNYPGDMSSRDISKYMNEKGCLMTAKVAVVANESGDKYNIEPKNSGWTMSGNIAHEGIYNKNAFAGGTSKIIVTVTEADVISAQAQLAAKVTGDGKSKLLESVKSDSMPLESTYKEENGSATSTPAVGEEVKDGVKPKLSAKTTYSILTLDKTNLKQFIEEKTKAKLADDQKIYEISEPFLEKFTEDGNGGYTARLKATTKSGPKVTEEEILEKSKGRKKGEVQTQLKSINGVSSCTVETSILVNTVPDDPNKVEVILEVEK